MILYVNNHIYHYELENLCRVFFPFSDLTVTEEKPDLSDDLICVTESRNADIEITVSVKLGDISKTEKNTLPQDTDTHTLELTAARMLFTILVNMLEYAPKWGVLTGVRPSKLMRMQIDAVGDEKAKEYFRDRLWVSDNKTELAYSVAKREDRIVKLSKPDSFSLYVSIPFCPTRCSYCSFVSHSIEQAKKLIPAYVENLCEELKITAEKANENNLKLSTVYFGGGTPTSLTAQELYKITVAVNEYFDIENCLEYTVEAGRPDTVTDEKFSVLKNAGVGRVSINPQTFNDAVLNVIGRRHTSEQTIEAYHLAEKYGFDINMDFIAGLPTDTVDSFINSIDTAVSLNPANITVHTLALKRASNLVSKYGIDKETGDTMAMLDYADGKLAQNGYNPYYMYRQSRSIGNLENVGFALDNKECLYNVYMMEEIHTVLAVGGGAVTKLVNPYEYKIDRVFNFKYPYEYINRFDEILDRKKQISEFYRSIGNV